MVDELSAISLKQLLRDHWQSHPQNPVECDCRYADPADRVFSMGNSMCRAVQNCCYHYGYGFNLDEITSFTPTGFEERKVTRAEPIWGKEVFGKHMFSRPGELHFLNASYRRNCLRENG